MSVRLRQFAAAVLIRNRMRDRLRSNLTAELADDEFNAMARAAGLAQRRVEELRHGGAVFTTGGES